MDSSVVITFVLSLLHLTAAQNDGGGLEPQAAITIAGIVMVFLLALLISCAADKCYDKYTERRERRRAERAAAMALFPNTFGRGPRHLEQGEVTKKALKTWSDKTHHHPHSPRVGAYPPPPAPAPSSQRHPIPVIPAKN